MTYAFPWWNVPDITKNEVRYVIITAESFGKVYIDLTGRFSHT